MIGNWIVEACSTVGGGALVLAGAPAGRASFSQWFSNGASVYYVVEEGDNKESGTGVYNAGTIQRTPASVLRNGVIYKGTPAPLSLNGDAIVGCTMSAEAYNAFDFDAGFLNHPYDINNPHSVSKTQVGLPNVPNLDTTAAVNHVTKTDNPHNVISSQVQYNNPSSNLSATNVYSALNELEGVTNDLEAGSGENHASSVSPKQGAAILSYINDTTFQVGYKNGVSVSAGNAVLVEWPSSVYDFVAKGWPVTQGPGFVAVTINSTGDVVVYDPLTQVMPHANILLGHVYYDNQVIEQVVPGPKYTDRLAETFYDLINFLPPSVKQRGFRIHPTTTGLSLWRESGSLLNIGGNNAHNADDFNASGGPTTGAQFIPIYTDGSSDVISESKTNIVPATYINAGTKTLLSATEFTIHYLFISGGGDMYLQYGQFKYDNKADVLDEMERDIMVTSFVDILKEYHLLAQIVIFGGSSDFNDGDSAIFERREL